MEAFGIWQRVSLENRANLAINGGSIKPE